MTGGKKRGGKKAAPKADEAKFGEDGKLVGDTAVEQGKLTTSRRRENRVTGEQQELERTEERVGTPRAARSDDPHMFRMTFGRDSKVNVGKFGQEMAYESEGLFVSLSFPTTPETLDEDFAEAVELVEDKLRRERRRVEDEAAAEVARIRAAA